MKNLFAVDFTDENNPRMPADAFCRRQVNDVLADTMDAHADHMMDEVEKATHSLPHFIGMGAAALCGVVCFTVFDTMTEDVDKIPSVAWLFLVAAAVALGVLLLVGYSYSKKVSSRLETDEMTTQMEQADAYALLSRHELGVPEDAAAVDVLCYTYEIKKGKEKPLRIANEHYSAMEMAVFVEDGHLMLADATNLYAFALSEVTAVTCWEGKIRVHSWNKEEDCNKEPYKAYRIRYDDDNDIFTVRSVYALEWGGADCELVVPDYEWERVLQPLTGLAVTATEKAFSITIG